MCILDKAVNHGIMVMVAECFHVNCSVQVDVHKAFAALLQNFALDLAVVDLHRCYTGSEM